MALLKRVEAKWQKRWQEAKIFEADPDPKREKCFITFPYPYMNGPLHVGHGFTATRVDAYARFKRMQGYNVLFPWAWHWTGQPLAGASERVRKGDKEFIRALREVDGVPEQELAKFGDPLYMAQYYTDEGRETAKKTGFSIDWRREFHTVMPTFQKFVEWQYERLREKGYVTKGTHPVVWCPHDQSPTGDADRQEGEGVVPEEYTLIKFRFEDAYLPAATFRPETIYGVTNLWLNPDATYVKARVDKETWIVSQTAADKLKEQLHKMEIISTFKGRDLIGKNCTNPVNVQKLPVLPGWFVDPEHATGVVYSVPAHAPYDWLALHDLQVNPEPLNQFGINPEFVKAIKPISIIKIEEYGEFPAVEIAQQLGARDQHDPRAEEATKLLYKKEFHGGILKANCGEYAGQPVRSVKEQLIQDFKREGIADTMYDLPQAVICRCMTPCIVKILEDQWFLTYSDPAWKEKTKQALAQAKVYPETAVPWFLTIIDWLKEWACARKTGFGTPLKWSPGWIIETLSDSTVYMAFYTINKHIRQNDIKPEQLIPKVFDYVFYGKGKTNQIAEETRIKQEILLAMRKEFLYWYPVDFRNSAKELVPNHLTFFLFHHVALFPPEHWPKAIGVNGMLMVEGEKMSKSKGNFITLHKAIDQYGADATRCALLLGAEGMDDPDWRSENLKDLNAKLESFYRLAESISENAQDTKTGHLELWLLSMLQNRVRTVTESLENMKTRTAIENAFYETWNDFRWYTRRKGDTNSKALKEAFSIWTRLMAPFAPHLCEEIWNKMDEKEFASTSSWPEYEQNKVDIEAEEGENLVKSVLDDTQNILNATKIAPKKIHYYTAANWKWRVYSKVLEAAAGKAVVMADLMKELMQDKELKANAKQVAKFVPQLIEEVNRMPGEKKQRHLRVGGINEEETLTEAVDFLAKEFNAEIQVHNETDPARYDPKKRAELTRPHRPAIFIE